MNPTGTQQVTSHASGVERDALASIFTPQARSVRQEQAAPDAAAVAAAVTPAQAVAQTTDAATQTASTVVADVVKETATAAPPAQDTPTAVNPFDSILDAALGAPTAAPSWTPEAVAPFKALFGAEDPVAYKTQVDTQLQQAELLKAEFEKVRPVVEQFNNLPPSILEPLKLAMQGKIKEAQAFLATTPEVVLGNKEASKCSDRELIDTYMPGKIPADKWNMLEDADADPDVVSALKERIKILRDTAEDKHTATLTTLRDRQAQEQTAQVQASETYRTATAATLSHLNSTPYKALADQGFNEEITTGRFISRYVNPDGSPTQEAATLHLKALNFDKIVEAADARGYKRGKGEGMLESTSRQPSVAGGQRRTSGDTPTQQTEEDRVRMLTYGALTARA